MYQWYKYYVDQHTFWKFAIYSVCYITYTCGMKIYIYIYEINHAVIDIMATFLMRAHWYVSTPESHVSKTENLVPTPE